MTGFSSHPRHSVVRSGKQSPASRSGSPDTQLVAEKWNGLNFGARALAKGRGLQLWTAAVAASSSGSLQPLCLAGKQAPQPTQSRIVVAQLVPLHHFADYRSFNGQRMRPDRMDRREKFGMTFV